MKRWRLAFVLIVSTFALGAWEVDWEEAEELHPGVELLRIAVDQPRLMKIFLMRVDLETEGLEFTGTARDADWGEPMPDYPSLSIVTRRVRTRDFMLDSRKPAAEGGSGLNMIAAVNSAPWLPWEKPFDHQYASPLGLAILDGEVLCDNRPHGAVFAVYENGEPVIADSVPEEDYPSIRVAAAGFGIILRGGELLEAGAYSADRHPRTAYGLSADRRFCYFLVIDGRQEEWSLGATTLETAHYSIFCVESQCFRP